MISACSDERGLAAVALHQLEPKHTAIERERSLEISHLEMDMADSDARVDCPWSETACTHFELVFAGFSP